MAAEMHWHSFDQREDFCIAIEDSQSIQKQMGSCTLVISSAACMQPLRFHLRDTQQTEKASLSELIRLVEHRILLHN